MSIIINFSNRMIQGFGYPGAIDFPVKITALDKAAISFRGSQSRTPTQLEDWSVRGTIDRVTNDLKATHVMTDTKTGKTIASTSYALKCRPAKRMS